MELKSLLSVSEEPRPHYEQPCSNQVERFLCTNLASNGFCHSSGMKLLFSRIFDWNSTKATWNSTILGRPTSISPIVKTSRWPRSKSFFPVGSVSEIWRRLQIVLFRLYLKLSYQYDVFRLPWPWMHMEISESVPAPNLSPVWIEILYRTPCFIFRAEFSPPTLSAAGKSWYLKWVIEKIKFGYVSPISFWLQVAEVK